VSKPSEASSAVKYSSFIHSCKMSPTPTKSTEKMTKKSHRKLDWNVKKSNCGHRKKSSSSKGHQKQSSSFMSTTTQKKSYKHLTRNPSKAEEFEGNCSAMMNTYTELMAKKRKSSKKSHRKELSQSFHTGQKPKIAKNGYLENYIKTVNRYISKEKTPSETSKNKLEQPSTSCKRQKKTSLNQFYFRRNTESIDQQKCKPKEDKKMQYHEISTLIQHFQPNKNISYKSLDPVKDFTGEQRPTFKNQKSSEVASNESTPRIEEEEVKINTLGGYNGVLKKSFHDKNMLHSHKK